MNRIIKQMWWVAGMVMLAGCVHYPVNQQTHQNKLDIESVWSKRLVKSNTSDYLKLRPTIYGNDLYVADPKGKVSRIDVQTQKVVWERNLLEPVTSSVAVDENHVVVGTKTGQLFVLNSKTGKVNFKQPLSSSVYNQPAISQGMIAVHTNDSKLYVLSAKDGKILWVYDGQPPELSLRGDSSPVINGEMVVVGFANGELRAFRLYDGHPLWTQVVSKAKGASVIDRLVDVDANVVVDEHLVFADGYHGELIAVDKNTGAVKWHHEISSHTGLAVDNKAIAISDDEGVVWLLDKTDGHTLWRQDDLPSRHISAPTLYRNMVVVGDRFGRLYFLARDTGVIQSSYPAVYSPIVVAPITHDKTLVVASQRGDYRALALR